MPWDFEAYVTTPLPGGLYTNKAAYIYILQSISVVYFYTDKEEEVLYINK